MARTRVKICGITRPEDAAAACACGADAIGIVFHPASPRSVSIDRARAILARVSPFVTPVGLFVDADTEEILDTAAMLGLRTVQLNGEQSPSDVEELGGLSVIKAIRVTRGELVKQLQTWQKSCPANLIGFVMETGGTKAPGGTGVVNYWDEIIAAKQAGAFGETPVIAAGGLTPENVEQVVRTVRPYAVDVSSGVESSLGQKSEEKIAKFITAVRAGDLDSL